MSFNTVRVQLIIIIVERLLTYFIIYRTQNTYNMMLLVVSFNIIMFEFMVYYFNQRY